MLMTPLQAAAKASELAADIHRRTVGKPGDPTVSGYNTREEYYAGKQPLAMASPEFRDYFADRFPGFSDNWCGVVADAPVERINHHGVQLTASESPDSDRAVEQDLARVWEVNEADVGFDGAALDATICDRAFVHVWGNDADESTPTVRFEHPSQATIEYDPETRQERASLKIWRDNNTEFATLSTATHVWKFQRRRSVAATVGGGASTLWIPPSGGGVMPGGWEPRRGSRDDAWPLKNKIGEVPLTELPNRPRTLGGRVSDIAGAMAMQDAINLLWAYLMNAADYASLPQRVLMSNEKPQRPLLDDSGQVVGWEPIPLDRFSRDRMLQIPGGATIGEFSRANLEVFIGVFETQVSHVASQTRTPSHYLIGKMANVSTDMITAGETGLVMRTNEKLQHWAPKLRRVYRQIALAQGDLDRAARLAGSTILFGDTETRTDGQVADKLVKLKTVGFSFEFLAEQYGLTPSKVKREIERREAEMRSGLGSDLAAIIGGGGEQ